jgi:hypothetical protein
MISEVRTCSTTCSTPGAKEKKLKRKEKKQHQKVTKTKPENMVLKVGNLSRF